jgi:ferredoxin-NADP reductase
VTLSLRIISATWEAPNIVSYELRPLDGGELPAFTAGAHIDITLPNGWCAATRCSTRSPSGTAT